VRAPRPTAGQASTEYIATIALVAVVLALAAPAVGAPSVASAVVRQLERALCIAGLDICDARMAADAGLAPCALGSEMTGHEGAVTVFSIELGARGTLTVTPQTDGTVTVVRTGGGSLGVAGGKGYKVGAGPVVAEARADAAARLRVQAARGWQFKNQAEADRFLEHAVRNTFEDDTFPPAWKSFEGGHELAASLGTAVGEDGGGKGAAFGVAGSAGAAVGGRWSRDGAVTLYGRLGAEAELSWPLAPTVGTGRAEVLVEYTYDRSGPRELAFRTAVPGERGSRLTETVSRLDLRDAGNRAVARQLVDTAWPWPANLAGAVRAVADRISSHGTIERTFSEVDDGSWGAAAEAAEELKFGVSYKRIKVRRSLVSASARAGGFERERLDCQVPSR
jgi:hypothetical protein